MNLVQIQERLKELPTPALMQIANGGSPIAPPYLALGELKRRESMMQAAQPQQGPMPSVKEQVEQAAGLAGLQKQMQAQGMQSLMAQARPQAIPQNIPQPERQPEQEGVAGLPTGDMYNFRNGGIVAFAGGGDEGLQSIEQLRDQYRRLLRAGRPVEANAMLEKIKSRQEIAPKTVSVPVAPMDEAVAPPVQAAPAPVVAPEAAQTARSTPEQYATARSKMFGDPQEVLRDVMAISDPAERAAALDSLKRPKPDESPQDVAPMVPSAPAMPPQGIAAIPGAEKATKMIAETMEAKPTLESEAADYEKAKGLFGLTQPYGEERMKRLQAMEAARQQDLGDRGLERLMRVMGGIAGRGLPGAGAAYLQSVGEERAADAAFRKQMDELLGGVEEARRKEAMTGMTEAQKRKARKEEMAIGAAEKIMDVDTKFKLQELQAKAATGRLSAEEQYIMSEINKGRSYPDIVAKIAEAKAGPRAETAEQQRFKDTYLKVAKAYDEMLVKPEGVSRDDYIRREVERAMGTAPIGGASGAAVPQQAIDYLKKNPNLAAQFDAKYGAGASAKYLGR